jgi:protein-tyrosine kinase
MSRIEKALEKAMELRESQKQEIQEVAVAGQGLTTLPAFEAAQTVIDTDLVDRHLVSITDPFSPVAEQYKKLRARILLATRTDSLNTLMVTSSNKGEGKTITAINLAVSLANAYDHTALLVDADLRNPCVSKYLGLKPKYGLTDCLAGKADVSDALIKTGIGKLSVLPAGELPENPAEILSSEKMKMVVKEMKVRYKDRYVIFDSSPVLAAADALSLGNFMDGILLVVQADHTSEKMVSQAVSLIKRYNILGVVLNNMPQVLAASLCPYYNYNYQYGCKSETVKESVGGNGGACETE